MGEVTITGYLCTFAGCDWTAIRPEPTVDYSETTSLAHLHVAQAAAMRHTAFEIEAQIVHHLNTAHPGWTVEQLRRNLDEFRRRTAIGVALETLTELRQSLLSIDVDLGRPSSHQATANEVLGHHLDAMERYLKMLEGRP